MRTPPALDDRPVTALPSHVRRIVLGLVLLGTTTASADPRTATLSDEPRTRHNPTPGASDELRPQLQADLGLSVIQLAYEHPVTSHVAASVSAGVFGTYFLPWFDLGDNVIGVGGGVRVTYTPRADGHGLYVAPYVRVHRVSGDHADLHGTGLGFSTGAFVGYDFRIGARVDLRIGGGLQYIRHQLDTSAGTQTTSTPFVALDALVGYRL